MKIYTRQGDQGQTTLFDGARVSKNNLRVQTYGAVDELNSHLGLAIAYCPQSEKHAKLKNLLLDLQHQLFDLGADLATPLDSPNSSRVRRITAADSTAMEKQIDEATAQITPLKVFVLPGGSVLAAQLHVARTVCRRAERLLVTLMQNENVGAYVLVYLNRLSDLLFTLARLANHLDGIPDITWKSPT
ncbi:MAG TPA: cob(I)yrinic acid a,c-diamide adenosyltransferase [Phycisphaerae bacterium]|nr:cob(I)yrinic acid a,c-diamide adenosyltransferase [Phycisphaerae bacterium]